MKRNKNKKNIRVNHVDQQKSNVLGIIFQFAAVFLGVHTAVIVLAEGIELEYNEVLLTISVFLSVLIYFTIFLFPEYIKYSLPVILIITALLSWKYHNIILDGLCHAENSVINIINKYFHLQLLRYIVINEKAYSVTALLILLVQFLVIIFSAAIYYGSFKWLMYIVEALILGLIYVIGKNPPDIPMLLLSVFIVFMIAANVVPVQEAPLADGIGNNKLRLKMYSQRRRIYAGAYSAVIMLILLVLISIIYPHEVHEGLEDFRKGTAYGVRDKIESIDIKAAWNNLSNKFVDTFFSSDKKLFNIGVDNYEVYYGGLSGGKLGKVDEVVFTNQTALKLTIPSDTESLYLKGYAGGEYSGNSWEPLSEEMELRYQNIIKEYGREVYTAQTQVEDFYNLFINNPIVIQNVNYMEMLKSNNLTTVKESSMVMDYEIVDKGYVYIPYVAAGIKNYGLTPVSDLYYKPALEKAVYYYKYYNTNYYDTILLLVTLKGGLLNLVYENTANLENFKNYFEYTKEYNQFAKEAYTALPDGMNDLKQLGEELLLNYASQNDGGNYTEEIYTRIYGIYDVIRYLEQHTSYTLSPGKAPEGKDYAEYFLFENKKGFCAHYATAATLLLRSMGIPARYVEGYIVTKEDINNGIISGEDERNEYGLFVEDDSEEALNTAMQEMVTVEIRDTNAHSWVEVYFDDFGWMPIEVTSGYADNNEHINQEIKDRIKDAPEPTKLPTNTPTPVPDDAAVPDFNDPADEDTPKPEEDANDSGVSLKDEQINNYSDIVKLIQWHKNLDPVIRWMLDFIMTAILIIFTLLIRYIVLLYRINLRTTKGNEKKKVLWLYYEMERLFKWLYIRKTDESSYLGFAKELVRYGQAPKNFEHIMEIILRSRFSNEDVTEDEYKEVYECYTNYRNTIFKRASGKKLKLIKYIVVI